MPLRYPQRHVVDQLYDSHEARARTVCARAALEEVLKPELDPLSQLVHAAAARQLDPLRRGGRRAQRDAMRTVERETHYRRETRSIHGIAETSELLRRRTDAH